MFYWMCFLVHAGHVWVDRSEQKGWIRYGRVLWFGSQIRSTVGQAYSSSAVNTRKARLSWCTGCGTQANSCRLRKRVCMRKSQLFTRVDSGGGCGKSGQGVGLWRQSKGSCGWMQEGHVQMDSQNLAAVQKDMVGLGQSMYIWDPAEVQKFATAW